MSLNNNSERGRVGLPPLQENTGTNGTSGDSSASGNTSTSGDSSTSGTTGTADTNSTSGTAGSSGQQGTVVPPQMTEAELLAHIQKFNPDIKSLDDLKKPISQQDQEVQKKKKEGEMVAWALKANKVDKDTYDKYQVDNAKPARQIVFEDFAAKQTGKTPQQIEAAFAKLYYEDIDLEDENTSDEDKEIFNLRQEEMKEKAKKLLRKNYPQMFTLEKEYDSFVQQQQQYQQNLQTLQQREQVYNSDIDQIMQGFKKLSYKVGDADTGQQEEIDFDVQQEVLDRIKSEFLHRDVMLYHIAKYDKEVLQEAIKIRLLAETEGNRVDAISRRYAAKMLEKKKIGRNHIEPDSAGSGSNVPLRDEELYRRVGEFAPENNY